eukprot:CAMPEP_0171071196 /NCGR_PEP_ID=MMETSP0766_2-20121228/10186_1 /TAXON_ID=439317 /ORGANISM="Gambierdiscus australes, Strain CAWD 149" /LENGTH=525 /DNA_ID=CAMNT_0011527727 /DNA_START=134 /DNA_END=1709 /DNA_ORIENTATION=-
MTLLLGILGYQVLYKLNFLAEVPFLVTARTPFSPTFSNWWKCEVQEGTCTVDTPTVAEAAFCTRNHTQRYWDAEDLEYKHRSGSIPCKVFDRAVDQKEVSGSLRISTRVVHVPQRLSERGWALVPHHRNSQHMIVGGEQMIEVDGELPAGMAVIPSGPQVTRLMQLQGFIRYSGEDKLRRIRCAQKGEWLPNCPDVPYGDYWAESYKDVSGSIDTPKPDLSYNAAATGCVEVVNDHLYCHMSELLRAAGIALDDQSENSTSHRISGVTLEVKLKVENWQATDFWRSPIALKPRFVIEVLCKGSGNSAIMYSTFHEGPTHSERSRVDHYGITLSLSPITSWAEFSALKLAGVLVVAMGAVRYANLFVTSILIAFYKWAGCVHVTALYEYNARQPSPKEHHVQKCNQPNEFLERHRAVEEAFLKELFRSEEPDEEENLGPQPLAAPEESGPLFGVPPSRKRMRAEKVDSVSSIASGSESDSSASLRGAGAAHTGGERRELSPPCAVQKPARQPPRSGWVGGTAAALP